MTLKDMVQAFLRDRKGVLALDEHEHVLQKRFSEFDVPFTEENQRAYFELFVSTVGIEESLSGVLLSEEILEKIIQNDWGLTERIASKEIVLGLHFADDGERDIHARLQKYQSYGIRAVKKSVSVQVGEDVATEDFKKQFQKLAEFSHTLQALSVVPILGIELILEGTHTSGAAEETLLKAHAHLVDVLEGAQIDFSELIIETSMASAGLQNPNTVEPREVAERTVRALTAALPRTIGGVLLFSNGESAETATADLNAIARLEPFPWPIAFCFARALQDPVLAVWQGKQENVPEAHAIFRRRLLLNSAADAAGYGAAMES